MSPALAKGNYYRDQLETAHLPELRLQRDHTICRHETSRYSRNI
jgi:hypothetical protein